MSSRHGGVPGWRFAIAVLALLLLPLVVLAALAATGGGLFVLLVGFFGAGGGEAIGAGLIVLLVAVLLCRICLWMRAGRKILVRYQRMLVGGFMIAAAPLTTWLFFVMPNPELTRANWIVTGVYMLFGVWLIVDAWEDRWSL